MKKHNRLVENTIKYQSVEWKKTIKLFYIWRDLFVEDVNNISQTDFLIHQILTYSDSIFKAARISLYNLQEIQWQLNHLFKMQKTDIINKCISL